MAHIFFDHDFDYSTASSQRLLRWQWCQFLASRYYTSEVGIDPHDSDRTSMYVLLRDLVAEGVAQREVAAELNMAVADTLSECEHIIGSHAVYVILVSLFGVVVVVSGQEVFVIMRVVLR